MLAFSVTVAVTLYATNASTTENDKCFNTADATARSFCCQNACTPINSDPDDLKECIKDCTGYFPSA